MKLMRYRLRRKTDDKVNEKKSDDIAIDKETGDIAD